MVGHVELAVETTKQLMTISAAIVTIGFAFSKDISRNFKTIRCIVLSVCSHFLSCLFGIWTLMSITGLVANAANAPYDIFKLSVQIPSVLQIIFFLFGLFVMIIAIIKGGMIIPSGDVGGDGSREGDQ